MLKIKNSRGDFSVIATIILVAVTAIAALLLFISVSNMQAQHAPTSTPKKLRQAAKIEGYTAFKSKTGYVFKLYVRNIGDIPFRAQTAYLVSPGGTVYKASYLEGDEIRPGEISPVIVGFNTGPNVPYGTYLLKLCGNMSCACQVAILSTLFENSPELKAYIIDLSNVGVPGHWVDPTALRSYLEKYAYVEMVDTWEKLAKLIANPPDRAIVINAHGELVPMPSNWSDWQDYFTKIGLNIRDRGWIWVSVKGYPFYYYYAEGGGKVTVGPAGVNRVLSVIGATADFWSASDGVTTTELTSLGKVASDMLGLGLAAEADTPRACRSLNGVAPALVFYSIKANGKTYYGSASYSVGSGFLIVNGFSPSYDNDQTARAAVLAAIYTYMYSARPPRKVFNKPPHVYILSLSGTHSHWVDKDEVAQAASWLASLYTPHVHMVTDYDSLYGLFKSPPSNCIVFNTHGEAVPIPDEYVGDAGKNWRPWEEGGAVELYIASPMPSYYMLYKPVDPAQYPEGLKVVYEHLILSDAFMAVGVFTGENPTVASSRFFHVETRVSADSDPLPDFVAVWATSTGYKYKVLSGEASYLKWYKVEVEVVPAPGGAKGKVTVYSGSQQVASSGWIDISKPYNSIKYVGIGLWDQSSRDGSYLVKYVELYKKTGNLWNLVWKVEPSGWDTFWSESDTANDPYRPRWGAYIARIAWNIKHHGWIWVSPIGYPFYYVVNVHFSGSPGWSTGDSNHEWCIGSAGINFMMRLLGGSAGSFFVSTECQLTDEGEKAASLFPEAHLRAVLPPADVARAQRIYGIPSSRMLVFYDDTSGDPTLTGSVSVLAGGALELNGYSPNRLTEASKGAMAFALYTYKKLFGG